MAEIETSIDNKNNVGIISQISTWIKFNPNSSIYVLTIFIGFFIRLTLALRAIGVYHPDEIFQSLEMAHLLVFDSGITPPEFTKENPGIPSYAASRSWIFPLIFAAIMKFGEIVGLDYHNQTLPLIRIFLAVNSTLLIPASRKFVSQLTHNDIAGVLAAIFVAFWWRLAELTIRPLSNTFFLPMLFYGLYRMLVVMEKKKISNYDHLIITIFVGLTTYIRLDLGIVVFAIFIVTFHIRHYKQYFEFLLDGLTGWLIGILVDYNYYERSIDLTNLSEYGQFVSVPVNWITFALEYGDLFGVSDREFYWDQLVVEDGLLNMTTLSFVIFSYTLIRIIFSLKTKSSDEVRPVEFGYIRLFTATVISWLISSSVWENETHKEIRFNMSGLVLLLFTIAVAMTLFIDFINETFEPNFKSISIKYPSLVFLNNVKWRKLVLILVISFLLINQSQRFQDERGYIESFDDVNLALAYVGQQANVTGVIVLGQWFLSGSYTYLHLSSDITIEYSDLWDPQNLSLNRLKLQKLIEEWMEGNYLILPLYQLIGNEYLIDLLIDNNFTLDANIIGKSEVWVRN